MELVRELFLTASLALVLSFLVAKLVAFALAGDYADRDSDLKSSRVSDGVVVVGGSLTVQGSESESRVEFVREAVEEEVDQFQGRQYHHHQVEEEISEQVQRLQEEILEEFLDEGSGKQSDGEETASVEKFRDSDPRGVSDGRLDDSVEETWGISGLDVVGGESATDDVVLEEVSAAVGHELKGKDELYEVGMQSDSEDDDWEGIERSELESDFAAAVKFVESGAEDADRLGNAGSDVQMELYGLHKVATQGPCYESQPMPLKLSARAKWNAWKRLGNMSQEMAMEQYVTILSDKVPGWMEDHLAGEEKPEPSKEEMPESSKQEITIAHVSNTSFHNKPKFSNDREPELNSGADRR